MKILKIGAIVLLSVVSGLASQSGNYHLLREVPIAPKGGWDYIAVDPSARRVYISHGMEVDVVDADSYSLVGKIAPTPGVHGIALAEDLGRGFISDGRASTITVFDLKTLKTLAVVHSTGEDPDAIVYDPVTQRVFAFNGHSGTATVLDARSTKVLGTIQLGGDPEFAVADGKGFIFNNLEDKSLLLKINARSLQTVARWPLAPCQSPSGLAMDRENRRLFSGCRNQVMVAVNADTGHVITSLPIGAHVDSTKFDPATHLVFDSNGDGTLTVIHQDSPNRYHIVQTVKTVPGARTSAVDLKTHHVFLTTGINGKFTVLVVGQ